MKMIQLIAAGSFAALMILTFSCNKIVPIGPTGGGSGGDTTVAPAQKDSIIYTDANPDTVIQATYNLDLNRDDSADFVISRNIAIWTCRNGAEGPATNGYQVSARITIPSGTNNEVMYADTAVGIADTVNNNVIIGADDHWSSQAGLALFSDRVSRCAGPYPYTSVTTWLNVADKYLGLKFIKAGNTYYGWARITTSNNGSPVSLMITVKDYAYNSLPGHPIRAGQTQ